MYHVMAVSEYRAFVICCCGCFCCYCCCWFFDWRCNYTSTFYGKIYKYDPLTQLTYILLSNGKKERKEEKQLKFLTFGIGLISVPSSCSMRCRAKRSSYVIKLIAIPRWPNLPERPIRWRYVSAILGKSKLITTFTAWTSMPRVNKSRKD